MNITEYLCNNFLYLIFIILFCSICFLVLFFYYKDNYYFTKRVGITIPPEILVKNDKLRGTIIDILSKVSTKYPNLTALLSKKDNKYSPINYSTYYNKVLNFAESSNYWIGSNINCAIIGSNSTGWFYSHLGTMLNKGISIGIYPTSSSDHIEYILQNSDAKILIIDGNEQLVKLINIKLCNIKMIVYYSPVEEDVISKFTIPVISMVNFMSERKAINNYDYPKLDDIATIIYTSGTTGDPKGAVLTHKNIMASVYSIINDIQSISDEKLYIGEKFVSYLPLNHILAQLMDIYIPICTMGKVFMADKDSIKNSLAETLKLIKPSVFISVPRIWEKISEGIEDKINKKGITGKLVKIFYPQKIIKEIGLDECKLCVTSGAPISPSIINYFKNIGLDLHNIYGMTESTGPVTLSFKHHNKVNSSGKVISSLKIKIEKDGEILIKGPTVFKGYYKNEKETDKVFKNSWFKTGDLGFIDEDNYLFINGRKKDIIITRGGENITPQNIENLITDNLSILNYAVLIGDNKKFLSVLLVLKTKTIFDNKLHNDIKNIDPNIDNINDAINSDKLKKYIQDKIQLINNKARDNIHKIQKWKIIPNNFKIGEEITPTLKIKRNFINQKYKKIIDSLYE